MRWFGLFLPFSLLSLLHHHNHNHDHHDHHNNTQHNITRNTRRPATGWFDLSFATKTQVSRTICTSDTFHDVRLKKLLTFHNGLIFLQTSLKNKSIYINKYIHVIMNRHRHLNIRNGFVWVQTSHSTCTCTATASVIELLNTPKIRIVQKKKKPQRRKSNSNLLVNSKTPPKSFELVSGRMVSTTRQIHNDCYDGIQGRNEVGTDSFFLFPFLRNKKKAGEGRFGSQKTLKALAPSTRQALASQTAGGLGRLLFIFQKKKSALT